MAPAPARENGTCSPRERYLFAVRTVLIRRENGRAHSFFTGQVQARCLGRTARCQVRGVWGTGSQDTSQEAGRPLLGWGSCTFFLQSPASWWSRPVRRPGEHSAQRVTDCAEGDLDSLPSAQNVTLRTKCPAPHKTSPHTALARVAKRPGPAADRTAPGERVVPRAPEPVATARHPTARCRPTPRQ